MKLRPLFHPGARPNPIPDTLLRRVLAVVLLVLAGWFGVGFLSSARAFNQPARPSEVSVARASTDAQPFRMTGFSHLENYWLTIPYVLPGEGPAAFAQTPKPGSESDEMLPRQQRFDPCPAVYSDAAVRADPTTFENTFRLGEAEPIHLLCFAFQVIDFYFYSPNSYTNTQLARWALNGLVTAKGLPNSQTSTASAAELAGYACLLPSNHFLQFCRELSQIQPNRWQHTIVYAVSSMLAGLGDQNTLYHDQDFTDSFQSAYALGGAGIGVEVQPVRKIAAGNENGYLLVPCSQVSSDCLIRVTRVYPEHPAAEAIQPVEVNDVITHIEGAEIPSGLSAGDVERMLRGDEGTQVRVTIWRHAWTEDTSDDLRFELTLVREPEDPPVVFTQTFDFPNSAYLSENKVGYIYLERFSGGSYEQFHRALAQLRGQGITSLVVDLMGNGGGLTNQAKLIAEELLPANTLLWTEFTKQGDTDITTDSAGLASNVSDLPLTVLVNGNTASASELLNSALQVHNRALTVGQLTYAKASGQYLLELSPQGSIRLTFTEYQAADGSRLHRVGVTPEVISPVPCNTLGIPPNRPRCTRDEIRTLLSQSRPRLTGAKWLGDAAERGYARVGDRLELAVTADHPLTRTTGSSQTAPALNLVIGDRVLPARWNRITDEGEIVFTYTVRSYDAAPDGIQIQLQSLRGSLEQIRGRGGWEIEPSLFIQPSPSLGIYTKAETSFPQEQFRFWLDPADTINTGSNVPLGVVAPYHQADRRIGSYSLSGEERTWFHVNTNTGTLTYRGPRLRDHSRQDFDLTVTARDSSGNRVTAEIQVIVAPPPSPELSQFPHYRMILGRTISIDLANYVDPPEVDWQVSSSHPERVSAFLTANSPRLVLTAHDLTPPNTPVRIRVSARGPNGRYMSSYLTVTVLQLELAALGSVSVYINPVSYSSTTKASEQFTDDDGNTHEENINRLNMIGVTRGCNPPNNTRFCPDRPVSRAEMATFLSRTLNLPRASTDHFVDDRDHIHEDHINRLATVRITLGCNPPDNDSYCPDAPVTRGELASFLTRSFSLLNGQGGFRDISTSVHSEDILRLAAAGITQGCNPPKNDLFCPKRPVTRAEMATFLIRSLAAYNQRS